jgi:hypothetical protein
MRGIMLPMNTVALPPDLTTLVKSLDADAIAHRLEELVAEEQAVRVLLRSARAREQAQRRRQQREDRCDS